MSRLDVDSNFGQIAQKIENHYGSQATPPPEGHPNARQCPQCSTLTWRYTRHCLCCGLDIVAMERDERRRRQTKRNLGIALFGLAFSGAMLWGQMHAPASMRLGMTIAAVIVMVVVAAFAKD